MHILYKVFDTDQYILFKWKVPKLCSTSETMHGFCVFSFCATKKMTLTDSGKSSKLRSVSVKAASLANASTHNAFIGVRIEYCTIKQMLDYYFPNS